MEILKIFGNGYCEGIQLKIKSLSQSILLIYRPPQTPESKFKEILDHFKEIPVEENHIILGDFNFPPPAVNWATYPGEYPTPIYDGESLEKKSFHELMEFTNDRNCYQLVDQPTRGNNILDLIYSNNLEQYINMEVIKTSISDHNLVHYTCHPPHDTGRSTIDNPDEVPLIGRINFNGVDWDQINSELKKLNFGRIISDAPSILNASGYLFNKIAETLVEKCKVKIKKQKTKNNCSKSRKILLRKRKLLRQSLKNQQPKKEKEQLEKKLLAIDNEIQKDIVEERRQKEKIAVEQLRVSSKPFFAYANSTKKCKSSVGPLKNQYDAYIDDPLEMAEILRKQYESVFSPPISSKNVQNKEEFFQGDLTTLNSIKITTQDVITSLKSIRKDAAPGPDHVPSILLVQCAEVLAHPLTVIFNKSIETGELPKSYKEAIITPLHKGGPKCQAKNYRPVALTSHLAKCVEKIVKKQIMTYLEKNNILNKNQHGFRGNRSTLSQLLSHMNKIYELLEDGSDFVDVIYLDYAKAFDKVDHGVLLHKLREAGIGGNLGKWLHSFLTGRTQRVSVSKKLSETSDIISGVPQGSVLGPILFILLIADIDKDVEIAFVSSFADDTKPLAGIKTEADTKNFQKDMNSIYKWTEANNMQFNSKKFVHLRYGPNKLGLSKPIRDPEGKEIKQEDSTRDLGVIMSADGTYNEHIEKTISAANRMSGFILRTLMNWEKDPMLLSFKAFVTSKIDYCSLVWFPHKEEHWKKLESIQRNFTNKIYDSAKATKLSDFGYWERLEMLGLYSIQRRIERYAIIYIKKLQLGLIGDTYGLKFETKFERHGIKCIPKESIIGKKEGRLRERSLFIRGPSLFNILPKDLRETNCFTGQDPIKSFKITLDQFLKGIPDKPFTQGRPRAAKNNSLLEWDKVKL